LICDEAAPELIVPIIRPSSTEIGLLTTSPPNDEMGQGMSGVQEGTEMYVYEICKYRSSGSDHDFVLTSAVEATSSTSASGDAEAGMSSGLSPDACGTGSSEDRSGSLGSCASS